VKENGFPILSQAAPRDHCISTSRFNTQTYIKKKTSILSGSLSIASKDFVTSKKHPKVYFKVEVNFTNTQKPYLKIVTDLVTTSTNILS